MDAARVTLRNQSISDRFCVESAITRRGTTSMRILRAIILASVGALLLVMISPLAP
jgi:hypothetical protein